MQQGPFGVAATTRRPVERPGEKSRLRVSDTIGAHIGQPLPQTASEQGDTFEQAEDFQPSAPGVSSATLFETSLIFSAMLPGEGVLAPAAPPPNSDWQPPASLLRLRDRSV